jgi:hypothetical protein
MSVRNAIVLFLALSTLSLLVACGSSSPKAVPPPGGGFGISNFAGTYVFSFSGTDINFNAQTSSFFTMVGTLTADGGGNISGGTIDLIDPNLGGSGLFLGENLSASKYTVGPDGRGTGTLVTPQGTFGIDFVLTSNGQGLITRFDKSGSGSGTLDLQGSATQSSLAALAFSLSGVDGAQAASLGSVGGFTLNTSTGAIQSGTEDFNEGGTSAANNPLLSDSSVVLTSGTAGTATLDTGILGPLTFDVFVIDSTHLKLIETDGIELLSGDAFTQQTSVPAGTLAFTLAGFDSSGASFAAGGLLALAANGGLSGIEDFNDAGSIGTSSNVSGTCTLSAGRCQVAFTNFNNTLLAYQFAVYPSSGGILLLEVDNLGITQGAAYVQSSTALSAPQGYGLNLTGFDSNSGFEVDDIAEFTAQAVGSNGSGDLSGIIDINDGAPSTPQSLGGGSIYTPDSPATGRGSITIGNANIFPTSLEYYTVDGSNVLFIEGDVTQVAAGTFQIQSASSSPGAAQPAHAALRPLARPMLRPHSALRRK